MQNKLYNQLIGRGHRLALRHIALATFLFAFCSCKSTDFKALSKGILQGAGNGGLSTQEVALGLREALKEGASSAAVSASLKDGFFKNSRIAIPWPSEVRNVKSTLDSLGLNSLTNQFVKSMNRGAEKAAQQAKPIFWKAIGGMSITDAWGILKGPKNAATHYLDRKTRSSLSQLFMPVVKSSLEDVSATRYWRDITSQYLSLIHI